MLQMLVNIWQINREILLSLLEILFNWNFINWKWFVSVLLLSTHRMLKLKRYFVKNSLFECNTNCLKMIQPKKKNPIFFLKPKIKFSQLPFYNRFSSSLSPHVGASPQSIHNLKRIYAEYNLGQTFQTIRHWTLAVFIESFHAKELKC